MPDIRQLLLASSQAQATQTEKAAQLPQQDTEHGGNSSLVRQGNTDSPSFTSSWLTYSLDHAGNFWRPQPKDALVPNSKSVWQPCIGALTARYPSDTEPLEALWF